MSSKQLTPKAPDDAQPAPPPAQEERGTNAVEHQPDPDAQPLPEGERKYIPGSPYRTGNY